MAGYDKYWSADERRAYLREYNLKKKYGLTLEQYRDKLRDQDGKCAICDKEPKEGKNMAVDHCHQTGKIRALLCHTCNNHLGIYESRKVDFEAYLEKFK